MALFTSIDQVSKPTTANFKTPIKQFDIEYHNEEFPYIIINNVFDTEERERLIWEELDFLCYDWKDLSYTNKIQLSVFLNITQRYPNLYLAYFEDYSISHTFQHVR